MLITLKHNPPDGVIYEQHHDYPSACLPCNQRIYTAATAFWLRAYYAYYDALYMHHAANLSCLREEAERRIEEKSNGGVKGSFLGGGATVYDNKGGFRKGAAI